MTNKRGRKPFPDDMKANTTSVRLTASQRETFKALGGNAWLKFILESIGDRSKYHKDDYIYELAED